MKREANVRDFFEEIFRAFEADIARSFRRKAGIHSELFDILSQISEAMQEIVSETIGGERQSAGKNEKPYWKWLDDTEQSRYYAGESFYQKDDYDYFNHWGNFYEEAFFKPSGAQSFGKEKTSLPYDTKIAAYYSVLGVPYASPMVRVKTAWKNLCKKYHPDYFSDNPSMQQYGNGMLVKATEAYKEIEKFLKLYGLG